MTHIGVHKQRKTNALLAISIIGVCFSTAFHCVTIVKFQMTADVPEADAAGASRGGQGGNEICKTKLYKVTVPV